MRRRAWRGSGPAAAGALAWGLAALIGMAPAGAQTAGCDRGRFVVMLDPGHTPGSPGATSAHGRPELAFNRDLAATVVQALHEAGFTRAMRTTDDDEAPTLAARAEIAERHHADLFLSLHHDSVQPRYLAGWTVHGSTQRYSDRFSGYSLFVSDRNGAPLESLHLAELLGDELRARGLVPTHHHAEAIPGEGRELRDPVRGIYRFDDLVVLKATHMPAVLLEAGLIVNRRDEPVLQGAARQRLVASAITAAVTRFCAGEVAESAASTAPSAAARSSRGGRTR